MSLRLIAEQAGVSISTVSRVVRNHNWSKVSDETRQRILEIARAINYQPNPQAVALATGSPPNTLGIVMPYHSHTFRSFYFSEVSCGILDAANDHGMEVSLLVYRDDRTDAPESFLSGQRAAGVILLGTEADDPMIAACRNAGIPCVVVNNDVDDPTVCTVNCDNEGGAYAATHHLIRLGHTRIAFAAGPARLPDAAARLAGYRRALAEAGIPVDPDLIVPGEFNEQGGRQAMRMLLDQPSVPTALCAANDQSAIGALAVAKRAGLRVPHDLALVGFDDIPSAQHADPTLTTIHQPIYRMGQRAAMALIAHLVGGNGTAAAEPHQVVRTRLVVRESCGARPSAA